MHLLLAQWARLTALDYGKIFWLIDWLRFTTLASKDRNITFGRKPTNSPLLGYVWVLKFLFFSIIYSRKCLLKYSTFVFFSSAVKILIRSNMKKKTKRTRTCGKLEQIWGRDRPKTDRFCRLVVFSQMFSVEWSFWRTTVNLEKRVFFGFT